MGRREKIQGEINALQETLEELNRIPEDRFHFNTVLKFVAPNGYTWFITKTGEETWINIKTNARNDLAGFILDANEKSGAYELYELKVQPNPIYAKE